MQENYHKKQINENSRNFETTDLDARLLYFHCKLAEEVIFKVMATDRSVGVDDLGEKAFRLDRQATALPQSLVESYGSTELHGKIE